MTREEEEKEGRYFKVAPLVEMDLPSQSARVPFLLQAVNQRSPPLSAVITQQICDVAPVGLPLPYKYFLPAVLATQLPRHNLH